MWLPFNLLKHSFHHLDCALNYIPNFLGVSVLAGTDCREVSHKSRLRADRSTKESREACVETHCPWTGDVGSAAGDHLVPPVIAADDDPSPLHGTVQFTKHILVHYSTPSSQRSCKKQTLLAPFFSRRNWRLSRLKWFSQGHKASKEKS